MFIRTKRVKKNGKTYLYRSREWRWRDESGRVRSRSEHLGHADGEKKAGWLRSQFPGAGGLDWDAIEKQQLEHIEAQDKAREEKLKELHDRFGLVLGPANPVPTDKPETEVNLSTAAPAREQAELGEKSPAAESEAEESTAEAGPTDAPSEVSE